MSPQLRLVFDKKIYYREKLSILKQNTGTKIRFIFLNNCAVIVFFDFG